ncbi:PH domain-containing protein [uncultured Methanobrevibacter sp.]|uniref:PH domain-containing protein n=1 Tax=uncultured Methanobrevibacter sp. TaxID=253161 RepID=UPI0025D55722|nr:PH domain-containing protein [uncultured Methanobrevibacter sp.]
MVKYCKNCGSELEEGSVFCDECGTKFGDSTPQSNVNYKNYSAEDPFKNYGIDMIPGERVIRSSQIHIGCLYLPLILMAIGFLVGLINIFISIFSGYFHPIFIFSFLNIFFIVGLIWFIIRYSGYKNNDLILTNKRVFGKCGLISTTQMQSPLKRIDSVSFSNGLIGKIIGYGTVEIATTSSHFKFRFIKEGQTLYNDIFNQLEISEKEKIEENAKAIAEAINKN